MAHILQQVEELGTDHENKVSEAEREMESTYQEAGFVRGLVILGQEIIENVYSGRQKDKHKIVQRILKASTT